MKIAVNRSGSGCPFFLDERACCGLPDGGSCQDAVRRPYTEEEMKARAESRTGHSYDELVDMCHRNTCFAVARMLGAEMTPEEEACRLKEMEEFDRTHAMEWVLSDDCPLRKGPVEVCLEEAK